MHDCDVTQGMLVELLFDELDEVLRQRLLAEIEVCADCTEQYRTLAETLRVIDVAAVAALPAEDFWPGYEERLSARMAAEIQLSFWQQTVPPSESARGDYHLTILEDEGVARRLLRELNTVAHESRLTWPEFKRDPFGFTSRSVVAYSHVAWRFLSERNVALATVSSLFVVFFIVGGVFALEQYRHAHSLSGGDNVSRDYEFAGWINNTNIPGDEEKREEGSPGLSHGKGGGSKPERERPGGGGGGGSRSALPTSVGKAAPGQMEDQILAPSVRQPTVDNPKLEMRATLKGDPLLLPEDTRPIPFGNPNSLSVIPSDGPGNGGGQGTGTGSGQGPGNGKGYGPGAGENVGGGPSKYGGAGAGGPDNGMPPPVDYKRTFTVDQVSRRAVITFKPDPPFTEEARRNGVTGTVRLRAILSANGNVTGISVIKGLPDGLTERAISAARSIRFQPAQKDGRNVSQYITLEYNFNIY